MRLPGLRFLRGFSLFLAVASSVFGQSYTVSTFAGGGSSLADGVMATAAQLNLPPNIGVNPVAVDSSGNLYIADAGNNRVREVSNGVITTVAGNGMAGFSGDGGPATSAELNDPTSVAVDSMGNLYIADHLNNRVREVSNGIITTVAAEGGILNFYMQGEYPVGPIAVDSSGNLYIADVVGFGIVKVSNGVNTPFLAPGSSLVLSTWARYSRGQ
jgi:sugar lactone lactonase YvrE